MMEIGPHTSVLVVGLGYRSGLAAANFLAAKGCRVLISDVKTREELADTIARLDKRVEVFAGNQDPSLLDRGFDLIVLSPGVPAVIPLVAEARRRGVPVIAEVELAFRFLRGRMVAITGTDGKSTTTSLVGHVLRSLGCRALVGGNIGIPLVSLVEESMDDTVSVIELSSFQLETVERLRPDVAAILNISTDHLDRYASMDEYFRAKLRIAMNQTADDSFVYNMDDPMLNAGVGGVAARRLGFSMTNADADAFLGKDTIFIRDAGAVKGVLDLSRMRLIGVHNVQNAMAALLMVVSLFRKMGKEPDYPLMAEACYSFEGLAHRMERIGELKGRLFVNDSKATTIGAVEMALKSLSGGIVLILGGRTKGDDYSRLRGPVAERVKFLVLIGESSREFAGIFAGVPGETAAGMDDALARAMRASAEGDTILLSPACASYDMFSNFEERGEAFRDSFARLSSGEISWT
ncbi:MAG TPA: UDP-N-acetylmuramoyl-L-alanine--D-glutamate ligase [Spirochaetota bacterium]|nr:UDP-N-acetylmuramoyl-L-alanine--D-glutamate ligase [Spirochaetota bacterium]